MAAFGWPLALNGVLMFAYQQGDQLVIGGRYSLEELAQYALAFSLTMAPGHLFQNVLNTSMLPLLAQAKDDPDLYRRRTVACVRLSATAGALIACALIAVGEPAVQLLFGPKYAGTGILIAVAAAANALRIVRSVTAIAAIARGDTLSNPLANLFRLTGLALALLAALSGRPLAWIAASGVAGEALALWVAGRRLESRSGIGFAALREEVARAGLFVAGSLGLLLLPAPASTLAAAALGAVAAWVLWRRTPELHSGRALTA
jgi:O-antigen/teichoic acid export membrane protein